MKSITHTSGLGKVLAEGVRMSADHFGPAAAHFAMEVKGLEMVCFEPRSQAGLALGYATAATGPRYDIAEHDWDFDTSVGWEHSLALAATLGIQNRIPMNELSLEKVRRYKVLNTLWSAADALGFCLFAIAPVRILSMPQMASIVGAITGWQTSDYELMQWGERRNQLMRIYNLREGIMANEDTLPARFFDEAIEVGPRTGDKLDRAQFQNAVAAYYGLMGWDDKGIPTAAALLQCGISV
jgi:aldehyde:ferredoxin oxidoreductase